MRLPSRRRRSIRAAAIVLCLTLLPVIAYAANRGFLHATLLSSTPAANSHLSAAPETITLVFSEEVVPELSQISLIRTGGSAIVLTVATDPHDVHTLVGKVGAIESGSYQVVWRVLSADGHPIDGNFAFSIEAVAAPVSDSVLAPAPAEVRTIPVIASVLRGIGLGAFMAGFGLLFFGATAGEQRNLTPRTVIVRLVAIGAVLLVAHLVAWMYHISPTGSLGGYFSLSVLESTPGKIEAGRVALALLALWALSLRRETAALVLGGACLVASGAIGHPAAIQSYWTIPAKMVHLLAGALWLGGLLWLIAISRQAGAAFSIEAKRVSSAALVAVVAILFSGLIQTRFFLNSFGDLIHSGYGRLTLIKVTGLVVLIGFGAYNRFGVLPLLDDSHAHPRLARSVRKEIVIVIVLILIGGFLAYVPTPPAPQSSLAESTDADK
jgi:copper transport protein